MDIQITVAAIRSVVALLREQLRHILGLVEDGAIRVQILPAVRVSIGMREPYRVMGFLARPVSEWSAFPAGLKRDRL